MTAVAWLVIITTAWSGETARMVGFGSMQECRAALSEVKISEAKGSTAVVAFCSPEKPSPKH